MQHAEHFSAGRGGGADVSKCSQEAKSTLPGSAAEAAYVAKVTAEAVDSGAGVRIQAQDPGAVPSESQVLLYYLYLL
jgi:hypothetical protein